MATVSHVLAILLIVGSIGSYLWTLKKASAVIGSATNTGLGQYQLAHDESLGFFRDVPEDHWSIRRNITMNRPRFVQHLRKIKPYFQMNYNPQFTCEFQDIVGHNVASGGKYVCDVHRLKQRECLVYSIYGKGAETHNYSFEIDLRSRMPDCEMHLVLHPNTTAELQGLDLTIHRYDISSPSQPGTSGTTLQQIISNTTRNRKTPRIDLFKVDLAYKEWELYPEFFALDIRQLVIKVHALHENTRAFFEAFWDAGYVICAKVPNLYNAGGRDLDFTFLKLNISTTNASTFNT